MKKLKIYFWHKPYLPLNRPKRELKLKKSAGRWAGLMRAALQRPSPKKKKYSGPGVSDVRKLKQLEDR